MSVARSEHGLRPAGHVENISGAISAYRIRTSHHEGAHRGHLSEDLHEPGVPEVRHPTVLVVSLPRMSHQSALFGMRPKGDTKLPLRPPRKTHVIEMSVREHNRLDIDERTAEFVERALKRIPGSWKTCIHDRQATAVLHEVPVRVGILDTVNTLGHVAVKHCLSVPIQIPRKPAPLP